MMNLDELRSQIEANRLGREERFLLVILADNGPLDSLDLWRFGGCRLYGSIKDIARALYRMEDMGILQSVGKTEKGYPVWWFDSPKRKDKSKADAKSEDSSKCAECGKPSVTAVLSKGTRVWLCNADYRARSTETSK